MHDTVLNLINQWHQFSALKEAHAAHAFRIISWLPPKWSPGLSTAELQTIHSAALSPWDYPWHVSSPQTSIVWCIDMARWWWVADPPITYMETILDLNKQLHFLIDSLLNICDLARVHNWDRCAKNYHFVLPWKPVSRTISRKVPACTLLGACSPYMEVIVPGQAQSLT